MSNILDNGFVKFLANLIRFLIWVFVVLIIVVVAVQRIFNNNVSIANYRMFSIASGSMMPEYKIFDVIISKEEPLSDIKKGDDLVYLGAVDDYKGKVITHRVVDIVKKSGQYYFKTQGISNPAPDPIVTGSQVYGIVVFRPVVLTFLSHILNNSYGLYFLIFVPTAFLIFLEIIDKLNEKERSLDDEGKEE
jgi:signal peptidase I